MDLGKKKKLGFLDQKTIENLVLQLSQVESGLLQTREALTDAIDNMQITQLAENVYQLGHVLGIYEMFGGYVNRSFGIIVEKVAGSRITLCENTKWELPTATFRWSIA